MRHNGPRGAARPWTTALLAAGVGAAGVLPAAAQDTAGTTAGAPDAALVGTVYDSTAAGPLAGAAVYLVDTPHVTVTDAEGRFAFAAVGAGTYALSIRHPRLDSLGFSVPPRWRVSVRDGEVSRVAVAVPSMATLLPGLCGAGARGAVVGNVRDASTGTPLPEATVEFVGASFQTVVEADASGRYAACGLPTGTRLHATASFLSHAPADVWLEVAAGQPEFHAFELRVADGTPVRGRVIDRSTGDAVAGAMVSVQSGDGERSTTFSDDEGRFELGRLDLETYIVEVEHLAFGKQMRWFTISDVSPMNLELALAPEALALEGLTVTVDYPEAERLARAGVRADVVSRPEIEKLLGSARNAGDLVRTLPGVRVRNDIDPATGQPRLCIEPRRVYRQGCQDVLVVIDGAISSIEFVQALPPQVIQSIEFIPSIVAGVRFGLRSGNGILQITTMRGGG